MEGKKRRYENIPKEIVEEVLVKLPVKSLMRFKAVSRECRGTIESKYFIEKHNQYQKSLQVGQVRIVVKSEKEKYNGFRLENMLVSANGIVDFSPYIPIKDFNQFDGYKISESCDGLICLYTYTRIFNLINPATTSRRRLPNPTSFIKGEHMVYTSLGIGRENSMNPRYKLLWFFECDNKRVNKSTRCMVFALDTNTWRYIDPPNCRVHYDQPLIHLDGVMYCFTHYMTEENHYEKDLKLLAFDLHTETFQRIFITRDVGWCRYCSDLSMCVLNHRLCIFKSSIGENDLFFNIWGLDIDKRSWEKMYSIDLSCFPPEFKEWRIIPIATINNYVIITNAKRTIWVLYGSKNCILFHTSLSFNFVMSYSETLVSPYQ